MNLLLGEIRGSIPARFWPPGLLLPGENLGEIGSRIALRFWPSGFLLLGENLDEICGRIPARFWPSGISLPSENLVGIRARFPPGRKISAAKISPGSQRDPAKVTLKMLVQRIIALSIKIWFHCKLYKVWV